MAMAGKRYTTRICLLLLAIVTLAASSAGIEYIVYTSNSELRTAL